MNCKEMSTTELDMLVLANLDAHRRWVRINVLVRINMIFWINMLVKINRISEQSTLEGQDLNF